MNKLLKTQDPDPLIQRLTESSADFRVFVRNLIQGEGVFLGAGCRRFFSDMMKEFFIDFYRDAMEEQRKVDPKLYPFLDLDEDVQGAFVTFRDFYHVTGVDFRVTGVNLDDAKPGYFSFVHTPDFPVGEAVAISMCIPGAFKPIIVEGFNRNGRWVDGGALINYPLHAFDRFATNLKGTMPYSEVFNENYSSDKYDEIPEELPEVNPEILGFRLVKDFPSGTPTLTEIYWKYRLKLISRLEKNNIDVNEERLFGLGIIDQKQDGKEVLSEPEYKMYTKRKRLLIELLERIAKENRNKITDRDSKATERDKMSFKNLLGDIFTVFMYSGGRGQIRANQDEKQTLTLPDFHISTLDFTPERNPRKVLEFIDARNEGRIDGRLLHPIIHAYDETKARVEKGFDNP